MYVCMCLEILFLNMISCFKLLPKYQTHKNTLAKKVCLHVYRRIVLVNVLEQTLLCAVPTTKRCMLNFFRFDNPIIIYSKI